MEIIFDNIIYFLQNRGGGSVYWAEITSQLLQKCSKSYFINDPNMSQNLIVNDYDLNASVIKNDYNCRYARYFPVSYRKNERHIFHSSYYRYSNSKNAINITTVHDFIHEKYISSPRKILHHLRKGKAIKKSEGIICISKNTKSDLINYFPYVDESRIKVIYNGVSSAFYPIERGNHNIEFLINSGLEYKKYILFVGNRNGYKNFDVAVDVVSHLRGFKLVIVGQDVCSDEKKRLDHLLFDRYCVFSNVNNKMLNEIYNCAFCLLYPTSYEGFGIPVIEAMRSNCPVLLKESSSLNEVGGSAAVYVENLAIDSFIDKIKMLENKTTYLNHTNEGLKQASFFSWEKCASETLKFYTEIFERSP